MAQASSSKGNPASKRMSNKNLKARREASWLRGQKRKAARIKAQKAREERNKELRAAGLPTPWEMAQARIAWRRERKETGILVPPPSF